MWFSVRYPIIPQRYYKRTWQSYDSIRYSTIRYDSVWFSVQSLCLAFLTACPGGPRWTFPVPPSATRLPTMPHISFQPRSECINSAPLVCIHRIGKSFVTSDWCMPFDDCESKNGKFFVLLPRFCMAGGVGLLMLYFISVCLSCSLMWCKLLVISLWEESREGKLFQFQLFQLNFQGW